MREILFRAYHIPTKRFIPVYGFNKENVFEETFDGIDIGTNVLPLSECILQQFTGLIDKNGTKIFEGDVILYQDAKGEVYYFNDNCIFMAKFEVTRSSWSFDSMDDEIEVVGNIYEL